MSGMSVSRVIAAAGARVAASIADVADQIGFGADDAPPKKHLEMEMTAGSAADEDIA